MPRLLLLNGPPAAGKSTLAERYSFDHPGVLLCEIDRLRTMVSGWREDFVGAGGAIGPAARAFIGGFLEQGGNVVLPQLTADRDELARFEYVARAAGADFAHVLLELPVQATAARFAARRGTEWNPQVRQIVSAAGGDRALRDWHDRLAVIRSSTPGVLVVHSVEADVEATYDALLRVLGERPGPR